ncbi:MAG: helix-turn-helix transcriptional regulator [Myxococcota bacterium]
MMTAPGVGPLLRQWRKARRMSQQQLALASEVSARHISFVENGKSAPSREMVLILANALEMPLRERNTLLRSAGFAPVYRESALSDPEMSAVREILEIILQHHEPYPAVVVDHEWNLVQANPAAGRVLTHFLASPSVGVENLMHALFHPEGLRQFVVNFEEVASIVVDRLYREALIEPDGNPADRLLRDLRQYEGVVPRLRSIDLAAPPKVAIPLHLRRGTVEVRLLSTITTFGTALDVTAQELRIESYFPADDESRRWVASLSAKA